MQAGALVEQVSDKGADGTGIGGRSEGQEEERVIETWDTDVWLASQSASGSLGVIATSRLELLGTEADQLVDFLGLDRVAGVGILPLDLLGHGVMLVVGGALLGPAAVPRLEARE